MRHPRPGARLLGRMVSPSPSDGTLAVYDLVKGVDRAVTIERVRLLEKVKEPPRNR